MGSRESWISVAFILLLHLPMRFTALKRFVLSNTEYEFIAIQLWPILCFNMSLPASIEQLLMVIPNFLLK